MATRAAACDHTAEIAELRERQAILARLTAQVAAKAATTRWTDFRRLLTEQYGLSHEQADVLMAILQGD